MGFECLNFKTGFRINNKLLYLNFSTIDLKNPKTNTKSAGFTIEERNGMTDFLENGFIDTFREFYPDKEGAYTYWSFFGKSRERNTGW